MKTKFDLEQQIMNTWSSNDDLLAIIMKLDELTEDQQLNLLIGHQALIDLKLENMFKIYEEIIKSKEI